LLFFPCRIIFHFLFKLISLLNPIIENVSTRNGGRNDC
jgi:hypothetical protein